ncbi:MAG: flagellar basal body-associated FliL family protein [Pirellulales bacterium]
MADDDQDEGTPDTDKPRGSRIKGLVIGMVVAVVAGAAGFAVPLLLTEFQKQPAEATSTDPTSRTRPAFVPFGETVVNLDEGRLSRYLRVSITLQVDESDALGVTEKVEQNKIILKNFMLSYLSDKRMEDIRGAAGQNRLRREIQDYFNSTLFPDGYDKIHDVLFEEFNIQ